MAHKYCGKHNCSTAGSIGLNVFITIDVCYVAPVRCVYSKSVLPSEQRGPYSYSLAAFKHTRALKSIQELCVGSGYRC